MNDLGPSTRKLLAMYIAREAIPSSGSFMDGARFILDGDLRRVGVENAQKNMMSAINTIREFSDYKDWDDEKIASLLVLKIEERKSGHVKRI